MYEDLIGILNSWKRFLTYDVNVLMFCVRSFILGDAKPSEVPLVGGQLRLVKFVKGCKAWVSLSWI